jgi:hypothetical protein
LFLLSKWFQKRRFLWEFPIGTYVKLSSAVVATLVKDHWAICNQTLVEWSLGGPFPKLCPVILTSNQRGRQAKYNKRGMELKQNLLL